MGGKEKRDDKNRIKRLKFTFMLIKTRSNNEEEKKISKKMKTKLSPPNSKKQTRKRGKKKGERKKSTSRFVSTVAGSPYVELESRSVLMHPSKPAVAFQ